MIRPDDDLRRVILDEQMNCESGNEWSKLERMLEDHKKILYPNCEDGQKMFGYHTGIAAMEGREWSI